MGPESFDEMEGLPEETPTPQTPEEQAERAKEIIRKLAEGKEGTKTEPTQSPDKPGVFPKVVLGLPEEKSKPPGRIQKFAKAVEAGVKGAKEGWREKATERKRERAQKKKEKRIEGEVKRIEKGKGEKAAREARRVKKGEAMKISRAKVEAMKTKVRKGSEPITLAEFKEKIDQDFENQFGIKKEELQNIEGWLNLTTGQQALVLENLRQVTLGRIQEEGLLKTQEETVQAKFLGRVWRNLFKAYYRTKAEKATAEEIMKGGMKTHGPALQILISGMEKFRPAVHVAGDGSLDIKYAVLSGRTPEEQKVIDDFNKVATEFSKLPLGEQKSFKKKETAYQRARAKLVEVLEKQTEEGLALMSLSVIDRRVRFNQFINTHPEAQKELQRITSEKAWRYALRSVVFERGSYMAFGYATRALTAGLLGAIAVPLTAAGIGSWIARKRAIETLEESAKLKKKVGKEREEILTFVDAENLTKKLGSIVEKISKVDINKPEAREELEKQLLRLEARLHYTWRELRKGLVDFGDSKNKTANQYELLQKLAEAELRLNGLKNREVERKLHKRLDNFLGIRERKMTERQKKDLYAQMLKGALWGAGFAALGYYIRDFFWGDKGMSHADLRTPPDTAEAAAVPPDTTGTTAPQEQIKPYPLQEIQGEPPSLRISEPQFVGDEAPFWEAASATPEEYVETLGRGGSVWRATEDQLEKHFGETFKSLGEGQRTHIIDAIKDKIVADPEAYGLAGITDIDNLPQGTEFDFSSIFQDRTEMESIFGKAGVLTEAQVENIERNNAILRQWVRERPGERLTSEKVEEILRGGASRAAAPKTQTPGETLQEWVRDHSGERLTSDEEILRPELHPITEPAAPEGIPQEAIPGSRKGEFLIPDSGSLHNGNILFFYDERTGLPVHYRVRGTLFGFNPEDRLKNDWFEIMSRKLNINVRRGFTPQDDYLLSRVRNLEIIERIADKIPKNAPEARFLNGIITENRGTITSRFGEVLKT